MEAGPAPPWQSWPCETRRFTHQPSLLSLNPANLQIWGRAFRDFKGAAAPWLSRGIIGFKEEINSPPTRRSQRALLLGEIYLEMCRCQPSLMGQEGKFPEELVSQ